MLAAATGVMQCRDVIGGTCEWVVSRSELRWKAGYCYVYVACECVEYSTAFLVRLGVWTVYHVVRR